MSSSSIFGANNLSQLLQNGLVTQDGQDITAGRRSRNFIRNRSGYRGTTGWLAVVVAGGTPAVARTTTAGEIVDGVASLKFSGGNATDYINNAFTINNTQKSSQLVISFDFITQSGSAGDWDIQIWDVTAGSQITVAAGSQGGSGGNLPAGNGSFNTTFTTSANTSYELRIIRKGGSGTFSAANFDVSEINTVLPTANGGTGQISTATFPTTGVVATDVNNLTLTNKTINATNNTIQNITNTEISATAAIAVNKLAAVTASRAVVSDTSGFITASTVTDAELGRLSGVTSGIQSQLDLKAPLASPTFTGTVTVPSPFTIGANTLTRTGAHNLALTTTAATSVTLPTTGTLATLAGAETLTNKTFNDTSNAILVGGNARGALLIGTTDAASFGIRVQSATKLTLQLTSTAAASGDLITGTTAGWGLPAGTTAQRPTGPGNGLIRYNTDNGEFEVFASSAWQAVGNGLNEQPVKNYLRTYANANASPGTLSTTTVGVAPGVSGNITVSGGTSAFYADVTSGSAALTSSASTLLRGSKNYLSAVSGAATDGSVFFQLPAMTLETADAGKPISISFDTTGNTLDGDWDVVVAWYSSAGLFQGLIPVAGNASSATSTPSAKLPTGTSTFNGFFVSTSTAGDVFALRFRRLANSSQIRIDSLTVSNTPVRVGAPVTDWQSYTPSMTGNGSKGTNANGLAGQWRRVGDTMQLKIQYSGNSVAAGAAGTAVTFTLPSSYTIDQTKLPFTTTLVDPRNNLGFGIEYGIATASAYSSAYEVYPGSSNQIALTKTGTATPISQNDLNVSRAMEIYLDCTIPIANWSSNVTMADRAVEEYASNSSTATGSDTTSFAYGASGSAIASITTTSDKRIRFQSPVQATDALIVEVLFAGTDNWVPLQSSVIGGSNDGTHGISINKVSGSTTDIDVRFGSAGFNATPTSAAAAWTTVTSTKWRVRKISAGSQVGFPIGARNLVGDTTGTAIPTGYLGEQIRSAITSNTAFPASTQYGDLTSISLTPGVWDISANLYATVGTAVSLAIVEVGISSTSGNSSTGLVSGDNYMSTLPPVTTADTGASIAAFRVLVTSTTTYYLKYRAIFASGSASARGRISAVRVG